MVNKGDAGNKRRHTCFVEVHDYIVKVCGKRYMVDEITNLSRKQPIAKPNMLTIFASIATSSKGAL